MLTMATPAFGSAYELWREDTVLRIVFGEGAVIGTTEVKELMRLAFALDPEGRCAILLECPAQLVIGQEARALVCRVVPGRLPAMATMVCRSSRSIRPQCNREGRPVAQSWSRWRRKVALAISGSAGEGWLSGMSRLLCRWRTTTPSTYSDRRRRIRQS